MSINRGGNESDDASHNGGDDGATNRGGGDDTIRDDGDDGASYDGASYDGGARSQNTVARFSLAAQRRQPLIVRWRLALAATAQRSSLGSIAHAPMRCLLLPLGRQLRVLKVSYPCRVIL